jgi:hypothetical protein
MIVNKYANRGSLASKVEVYPVPISIINRAGQTTIEMVR